MLLFPICFRETSRMNFYVEVATFFLYPQKILVRGFNNHGASSQLESKRIATKINKKKNNFFFHFPKILKIYFKNHTNYLDLLLK